MLEVREVTRRYSGALAQTSTLAVDRVSLTLARGQTLALLGPSGCGKSTLLRLIAGLERPDSGQLHLNGRDAAALPPEARQVGMVFQDYALFPHLSVLGNVAYGPRQRGLRRAAAETQAQAALALVGLAGYDARRVGSLSGGQAQRVALARALATRPHLLLLDEPLSNLDEALRSALRPELARLFGVLDAATLLVTHDVRDALALASQLGVMRAGRLVQLGAAAEVLARPASAWVAAFLGERNLWPEGGQLRWVPERALVLGEGEAYPVIARTPHEGGLHLTVAHPRGPLTLHLSPREAARLGAGGPPAGEKLALRVDQTQTMLLTDDR
jgi:iron(III) transport system ATP-binding protein